MKDVKAETRDHQFEQFVRQRRHHLLRTARVLAAGDGHLAEDLVQQALVRVYLAWPRVSRRDNVDAYTRKVLVNGFIDHTRRPRWQREHVTADLPELPDAGTADDLDPELLGALGALPERMRAAVVLRHVLDLSVEESAHLLGCSTGTVKSQTFKGLAHLRDALPHLDPAVQEDPA